MGLQSDLPDLAWARGISSLEDADVRARLENVPVETQVGLFLALDWEDRLKIVRNSRSAADLVRALPEEEVFMTVRGAGVEDSLALVALTTPSQLRFILDVDLWTKDKLDDEKAQLWLDCILSCGEQKIIEFAEMADRELLVMMLGKLIGLIPNEEGVTAPEGLPSIMMDEFFTIVPYSHEKTENIGLLLRILRGWDRTRFYKLLYDVYSSFGPEAEESALRWRTSRLEEKGLLEFDEAVEIYGYIGEDEAGEIAGRRQELSYPSGIIEGVTPTYPVLMSDQRAFFYEILASIEDRQLQNRLRTEIAFSANRLLVADARKIGEIDSMKAALSRLFALVNVGLHFLTGGERQEAIRVLKRVAIRELFQIGFSRVSDLRTVARDIAWKWWPEWRDEGFVFLGYPQEEVMTGLMLRIPQYYALEGRGDVYFRDFETMEEVHETRRILGETGVVAEACFDRLGIPRPHDARPALRDVLVGGIEEITLRNIVLTGFVSFVIKDRFELTPLSRADVEVLFEKVLEKSTSGERLIREGAMGGFLSWLSETTGLGDDKWVILRKFCLDGLAALQEDLKRIATWQDLDPRYVGSLIFGRWPGHDER
jgi:hypothetical protein